MHQGFGLVVGLVAGRNCLALSLSSHCRQRPSRKHLAAVSIDSLCRCA